MRKPCRAVVTKEISKFQMSCAMDSFPVIGSQYSAGIMLNSTAVEFYRRCVWNGCMAFEMYRTVIVPKFRRWIRIWNSARSSNPPEFRVLWEPTRFGPVDQLSSQQQRSVGQWDTMSRGAFVLSSLSTFCTRNAPHRQHNTNTQQYLVLISCKINYYQ